MALEGLQRVPEGLGEEPGVEGEGERVDDREDEERVALNRCDEVGEGEGHEQVAEAALLALPPSPALSRILEILARRIWITWLTRSPLAWSPSSLEGASNPPPAAGTARHPRRGSGPAHDAKPAHRSVRAPRTFLSPSIIAARPLDEASSHVNPNCKACVEVTGIQLMENPSDRQLRRKHPPPQSFKLSNLQISGVVLNHCQALTSGRTPIATRDRVANRSQSTPGLPLGLVAS